MLKLSASIALLSISVSLNAWALPSGKITQLKPTQTKSFYMTLMQDIELDRFIESFGLSPSFYANSATYVVDGQLMTEDEYYRSYKGQSYCEIYVFDTSATSPTLLQAGTVQTQIADAFEVKDSNWKDGAYNWAALQGPTSNSGAYIASVSCHIEGSLNARFSPPVSVEKMQEMLSGVVQISEKSGMDCTKPNSDKYLCTQLIDTNKLEYVNCLGEIEDGYEAGLCSNLTLISEDGSEVTFDCLTSGKSSNDPYLTAVCSKLPKPNTLEKINCWGELEDGYQLNLCSSVATAEQEWLHKVLWMMKAE